MSHILIYHYPYTDNPENIVLLCEDAEAAKICTASIIAENVLEYDDLPEHREEIKAALVAGNFDLAIDLYCKYEKGVTFDVVDSSRQIDRKSVMDRLNQTMKDFG